MDLIGILKERKRERGRRHEVRRETCYGKDLEELEEKMEWIDCISLYIKMIVPRINYSKNTVSHLVLKYRRAVG